jgi:hypothetical protein
MPGRTRSTPRGRRCAGEGRRHPAGTGPGARGAAAQAAARAGAAVLADLGGARLGLGVRPVRRRRAREALRVPRRDDVGAREPAVRVVGARRAARARRRAAGGAVGPGLVPGLDDGLSEPALPARRARASPSARTTASSTTSRESRRRSCGPRCASTRARRSARRSARRTPTASPACGAGTSSSSSSARAAGPRPRRPPSRASASRRSSAPGTSAFSMPDEDMTDNPFRRHVVDSLQPSWSTVPYANDLAERGRRTRRPTPMPTGVRDGSATAAGASTTPAGTRSTSPGRSSPTPLARDGFLDRDLRSTRRAPRLATRARRARRRLLLPDALALASS